MCWILQLAYAKVEPSDYEFFINIDYHIGPTSGKSISNEALWYGISRELNLLFMRMTDTVVGFDILNDEFFENNRRLELAYISNKISS